MKWVVYVVLILSLSSCKVLEKLDFPDDVHEKIENQGPTVMSNDINFAGRRVDYLGK